MVNIPLFTGFCTSQVVQDFFHQQYCQIRITFMTSQVTSGSVLRFNIGPENRPKPKRKGSSPNHHFSGAMSVSGRVSPSDPNFTIVHNSLMLCHHLELHPSPFFFLGGGGGWTSVGRKDPSTSSEQCQKLRTFGRSKWWFGINWGLFHRCQMGTI